MLHELDGWDLGNSRADRSMVHVVHIDKLAETVGADDPAGTHVLDLMKILFYDGFELI